MTVSVRTEPASLRVGFTLLAVALLAALVLMPLALVFTEALAKGLPAALEALADPDTRASIVLSLIVTPIVVVVNTLGGLAACWCIARFRFHGRALLLTIIELPLSISPVKDAHGEKQARAVSDKQLSEEILASATEAALALAGEH